MRRQAEWDAFARGADRPLVLGSTSLAALPRFQRIEVSGRFDAQHQFLLDNRTHNGRAGYEVLTPLQLADGRTLLVDRGWVAFTGYRRILPDIHLQAPAAVSLSGRVDQLPTGGLALGRAAPAAGDVWPKVTSYPSMSELATALGRTPEPRIVLLDPGSGAGYVRDWQPPGLSPVRHWSYAVQWWGFAVTAAALWVILSAKRSPA
jgi:surfeit locus 1 family protein